jgi:ABC-type transport system involved in multi-copper enzyme maturation permease subunit
MMRLLCTLIQRELLEDLTSSRYVLTSVLCVVLCMTSIVLMSGDYGRRLERYNVRMLRMTEAELQRTLSFAKRPQPLSVIARGVDDVMGRPLNITGWQPEEEPIAHVGGRSAEGQHLYGSAQGQHLFDLFTTPDFVYIVGMILSAFAIFLSFGTICGEKQTHTLSLLMSHPIRRPTLLFAKWMGGYISLLISLCPAMLLMLVFLTVSSGVSLQTEDWMRLLGIIVLSFVYLLIFFTLGLFTSTLTHRPATALILVLFIWALWVLGVPRIGCSVAKGLRPIQPNFTFGLNKRAVRQGSFEEYREILWKLDDEYIATVDAQMGMGQHLSRLSPFASYVYASSTLAQTGISDAKNFRQQVAYWDRERRRGRPTGLELPALRPEQSFQGITLDLILLLLWNVLLFLGANVAFLHYDVR